MSHTFILTLTCADQPGIVAKIAGLIFENSGNVREAQQYTDFETGRFFLRIAFDLGGDPHTEGLLRIAFAKIAARYDMTLRLRPERQRKRVLLLVSKFDHCLGDLLYRNRIGEMEMDVVGIVSNHPRESLNLTLIGDIPYHHLPITKDTKPAQEAQILALIEAERVDLVVLARYMQVLSADLSAALSGRCINIHHSFLPGFKGARPYHQAHARGVKIIGATAHYVTSDLDEGPIIVQDIEHISHADTPAALVRKGRDIERRVLARAVHYHLEDRVFINGDKTVVFPD